MTMTTDASVSPLQQNRTDEFVLGLRALADWYEANPGMDTVPQFSSTIAALDATEFARVSTAIGGVRTKVPDDHYFAVERQLSANVSLRVIVARYLVCDRVVTGTEVVTVPDPTAPLVTIEREVVAWKCRPLGPRPEGFDMSADELHDDEVGF